MVALPELPDVEVYRRYLNSTALHKQISAVKVRDAGVLRGVSGKQLGKKLEGRRLESTMRRGKHMLAGMDSGHWLTFHFGMTGYLEYFKTVEGERDHNRVVIDFANGYHLAFVCRRKLGRMGLIKDPERFFAVHSLGPDALDLECDAFMDLLHSRRGVIKSALMDQRLIAGIGNIYADEMLYQAGIHPGAKVGSLGDDRTRRLLNKMRKVLNTAIERKADPDEFPRTWLLPHRREGTGCPKCKGEVKKIKISGRSTYFCPACQSKR